MNSFNTQGKELVVRKRTSAFLEKLLRFLGHDFCHDDFKKIIYGEKGCFTPFEEKIKCLYDAYQYLLSNAQSPLSTKILKRFFYILNGIEPDEDMVIRMVSRFFHISDKPCLERAIEYHLYVYEELSYSSEEYKFIVSLMIFNYALVKGGIPSLRFVRKTLKEYVVCRDEYLKDNGKNTLLYNLFLEQLKEAKFQDKSFYGSLRPLWINDVYDRFYSDRELLRNKYGVKSISIFGSFAKGLQRMDSDIDLLIVFLENLSYEEKRRKADMLMDYYFNVFNRFIDVTELSEYVNDCLTQEITLYKKIF